ncbi:hypothetical protein COO60DRAFT_1572166, partial [Scenedesmus sp. NREL 46B-D3]
MWAVHLLPCVLPRLSSCKPLQRTLALAGRQCWCSAACMQRRCGRRARRQRPRQQQPSRAEQPKQAGRRTARSLAEPLLWQSDAGTLRA